MPPKKFLAALKDEEEEEEEDEALPEVYVKAATSTRPDTKPILAAPAAAPSAGKKAKGSSTIPPPPALPMDVHELQQALLASEGRLVGFQAREQTYLHQLTEKDTQVHTLQAAVDALAAYQRPPEAWARKALVDPGVAMELRLLHDKIAALEASKRALDEQLQAQQFSTESAMGERLLKRCQQLQRENEVLAQRLNDGGGGGDKEEEEEKGEKAQLKAEVGRLKTELAKSQARAEELDEERGLLSTMVYALKKQVMAAGEGGEGGGLGEESMQVEAE